MGITPVISALIVYPIVGAVAPLNAHPAGGVINIVTVHAPVILPKSLTAPSAIVITPSVVNAGALPPTARLLQIFVPPVAGVTVIVAEAILLIPHSSIATKNILMLLM